MTTLNQILAVCFDVLLYPFRGLPLTGLTLVSLVTAVFMLIVFKHTSDQERLDAVKRQIHACIFEIRLFNDDLRAILRAQWDILRHNGTYIRLTLLPMVWILVPLVLVVAQLQFHYGYSGLEPGDAAVVVAELREDAPILISASGSGAAKPALQLHAPEGVEVETPAVWAPALRQAAWRVRAERPGTYELELRVGDETVGKRLQVSEAVVRRSPVRVSPGFLDQLIYPAEAPLPADSALQRVTLSYPDTTIDVLGWGIHWMIVFFALSIVFAFMLRKPLGVTI